MVPFVTRRRSAVRAIYHFTSRNQNQCSPSLARFAISIVPWKVAAADKKLQPEAEQRVSQSFDALRYNAIISHKSYFTIKMRSVAFAITVAALPLAVLSWPGGAPRCLFVPAGHVNPATGQIPDFTE